MANTSSAALRPTQWVPGQSGNPGGRPRIEARTIVRLATVTLADETLTFEERLAEVREVIARHFARSRARNREDARKAPAASTAGADAEQAARGVEESAGGVDHRLDDEVAA